MEDAEIAIIGAGVAGLAAAARLRAAGRRCIVLEAADRVGGRAWTLRPEVLGGAVIDMGAGWLHNAEENPLVPIARAAGAELREAFTERETRLFIGGRAADAAELAAYAAAEEPFIAALAARAEGPDCSLAEAVDALRDDAAIRPWAPTLERWEASIIAAADPRALSLHDWRRNLLHGSNLTLGGGIGRFVADILAARAGDIRLGTAVRQVDWSGPRIALTTDAGTLTAQAAIVTVSTGVLRAGGIRFTPELPAATQAALDGLPMGLLSKVVLATPPDVLGLAPGTLLDLALPDRDAPAIIASAAPDGSPAITCFIGGQTAWDLASADAAASFAAAIAHIGSLLGTAAATQLRPGIATGWGTDPHFHGAYAYARPGAATCRAALAVPVEPGRLVLAGEACHTGGLAGTLAGAWETGVAAAGMV